jgi:hypothetical protein
MSKVTLVALVLGTFAAACGGPASNQPPPSTPPSGSPTAGPAAAPAAPAAAPVPLADPRAESYGGTVGSLDEITWLVATSRSAMHAHQAGYTEMVDGVALHRGPNGLEWATFHANGGFKATKDGIIVGTRSIAQGTDPSGRPHASWKNGPDQVIKFRPVPAAKLAALRSIVERTPLPIQPTKTLAMGVSVEISTATRHMQGDFGGSLGMEMRLSSEPAPAPSFEAQSTGLADMAARIVALFRTK